MAYGLKYYTEFADKYDHAWLIEFYFKDYSGSSTEVLTAANPLTYNYGGDDRDITRPIFGKEAVITLMSVVDFQFIDFHAANSRSIRCDIKKDGVLDFSGWVLPDLFTEPYIAPPYPVSISCRCGLGELSELEIPNEINQLVRDEGGEVGLTTFPDLYSIIVGGLLTIETDLKLNEAINVYSNTDDLITNSPIADTNINLSAYEGKSYYDAISDILKTFGARLYQMEGEWWIMRIKELKSTMSVRQWTMSADGVNVFTTTDTKLTTFKVGKPEGSNILQGANLDVLPAWKQTTEIQTLGKVDNLLKNGDFSNYRYFSEGVIIAPFWEKQTDTFGFPMTVRFQGENPILKARRNNQNLNTLFNESVYQVIKDIKGTDDQYLFIEIDAGAIANAQTATADNTSAYVMVKYTGISGTKYLRVNEADENNVFFEWTDNSSYLELKYLSPSQSVNTIVFSNFKINTPNIPFDGELEIKLSGGIQTVDNEVINNFSAFNNVVVSILNIDGTLNENTQETTKRVNNNNIYIPEDVQTVGGDLPDITNNTIIWTNGYRRSDETATKLWHERDSITELPLIELTQQDYKEFFYQPQFKLSLPILSENINIDSCIVDYQILPKKYICNSATIDVRNSIFSGTFMEFGAWEEGNWVLKDGVWTDENVWIEEGEVWED